MPGDLERIGYDQFSNVVLNTDIDTVAFGDGVGGHVWDKEGATGGMTIEGAGAGTTVRPEAAAGFVIYQADGIVLGSEQFAKVDLLNPGGTDENDAALGVAIKMAAGVVTGYILKARKGEAGSTWEVKLTRQTAVGTETNLFPADATWHDTGLDNTNLGNPLVLELIGVTWEAGGLILIARFAGKVLNRTGGGRSGFELGLGYSYLDTSPLTGTYGGLYGQGDGAFQDIQADNFVVGNCTKRGYGGIGIDDWIIGRLGSLSPGPTNDPDNITNWRGGQIDLPIAAFDPNAAEELSFGQQAPHLVGIGSPLLFHVHFVTATIPGAGEFINWIMDYAWAPIQGEFNPETTIQWTDYDPNQQSTSFHHVTPVVYTPGWQGVTPLDPSSMALVHLRRGDDSLKYNNDVYFLELDAHVLMHTRNKEREIFDIVNAERRWWFAG